jgi:multidrug resistance protein MdtO
LRLLAQLARERLPGREQSWRSYSLRETINNSFDHVRALAGGVLFEFGPSRQQDLALRSRIRQVQPQLHMLFVTRLALLKYRLQLPGFELPEAVRVAQQEFDDRLAGILDGFATRLEGKTSQEKDKFEDSVERLDRTIQTCCSEELATQCKAFLPLSRRIESLTISLEKEISRMRLGHISR